MSDDVKERPVLFNGAMVRRILSDDKTKTRRVMKPQPEGVRDSVFVASGLEDIHGRELRCPYGVPGDRLWVRESWQHALQKYCTCPQPSEPTPCDDWMNGTGCRSNRGDVVYKADGSDLPIRWHPSIHMPRWASRITLKVTNVRVERLQDISEEDAIAEGVQRAPFCKAGRAAGMEHVEAFEDLWQAINGKRPGCSWADNPWVWVVEFRRMK